MKKDTLPTTQEQEFQKEINKAVKEYVGPGIPPPRKKPHWMKRLLKYISL